MPYTFLKSKLNANVNKETKSTRKRFSGMLLAPDESFPDRLIVEAEKRMVRIQGHSVIVRARYNQSNMVLRAVVGSTVPGG